MSDTPRNVTIYPSGKTYRIKGDCRIHTGQPGGLRLCVPGPLGSPDTVLYVSSKLNAEIVNQLQAEMIASKEVIFNQTRLMADLLSDYFNDPDEIGITNLYPDPSDWSIKKCGEWLDDVSAPVPTLDGDDDVMYFRQLVSDHAAPAKILEWWLITEKLAEDLIAIGQPVLSNDYGQWWGRTNSGQAYICDGTLQDVASHRSK